MADYEVQDPLVNKVDLEHRACPSLLYIKECKVGAVEAAWEAESIVCSLKVSTLMTLMAKTATVDEALEVEVPHILLE